MGCADCHTPRLQLLDPVFREPSRSATHRDAALPAGQDPVSLGVDPRLALRFDRTRDQPDNQIADRGGVVHLGSFTRDRRGRANVRRRGGGLARRVRRLPQARQRDLIAFLDNLVLFKQVEE